jgi:hypothetical protein
MYAIDNVRLRPRPAPGSAHQPVEEGTADGKTRISCAGSQCAAWNPRPCESRREAQFWYNRHISQSLIRHLW